MDDRYAALLEELLLGQPWRDAAACRGYPSDLFFPERGGSVVRARAICAHCTVWPQCLEFAVATRQVIGVWGGSHYKERQEIRNGRLTIEQLWQTVRKAAPAWSPPT